MVEDNPAVTTKAGMTFDTTDPYAVTLDLPDSHSWILSRELLMSGGGEGDVKVFINEEYYIIFLMTTCGIVFKKEALDEFLIQCGTLVPTGTEPDLINWDEEMVHILSEE